MARAAGPWEPGGRVSLLTVDRHAYVAFRLVAFGFVLSMRMSRGGYSTSIRARSVTVWAGDAPRAVGP